MTTPPVDLNSESGSSASQGAPLPSPYLRPPANRLQRRTVWWWMMKASVWAVIVWSVIAALYFLIPPTRVALPIAGAIAAVFTLMKVIAEPWWRLAVHRWDVTDDAVFAREGWWVHEWRAAPISRIQTVDAVQGPLEQLFKLSTLRVTTASSQGPVQISGLDKSVADSLAARLTHITGQVEGDAT